MILLPNYPTSYKGVMVKRFLNRNNSSEEHFFCIQSGNTR